MTHIRATHPNPWPQQLAHLFLVVALSSPWLAIGAPAQKPLLTASEPPKPNVLLTLDDSGSMNFHMMPDDVAQVPRYDQIQGAQIVPKTTSYSNRRDTRACRSLPNTATVPPDPTPSNTDCYRSITTTDPIYSYSYTPSTTRFQVYPRLHPNDQWGYGRNYSGNVGTEAKGANNVDNLFVARFRSSAINGAYYNPDTKYVPWPAAARRISSSLVNDEGYVLDYTRVPMFPDGDGSSNNTLDLVTTQNDAQHDWCISGLTNINSSYCPSSVQTFHPAVYFNLKSGRTGNSYDDFERVDINAITDPTLKAAQLKNFVTWFTYYRSRILTAKGAVALAFSKQPDSKFRLGYGNINRGLTGYWAADGSFVYNVTRTSVDGYQSHLLAQGVRLFDDTTEKNKTNFFSWVRDLVPNGAVGTPLRMAMDDAGGYYSFKSNDGDPYRTNPTVKTDAALACRRSYHILVTDGYWNDPDQFITKGNTDNTSGPTITGPNSATYTYSATSPFKDNASNTLADVAMHYWKNDIRPDLDNIIPISDTAKDYPNDPNHNPAFWQHVTNFMVGLGVDGTVPQSTPLDQISWPNTVTRDANTTIDDLWHAAINSRGKYLKATNPVGFADELTNILSKITTQGGTVAGVAVSSAYVADGSLKLVPSFEPAQWSGELKGIAINAKGQEKTAPAPWLASRKVPAFALRNIWTRVGDSAVEFTFSNLPSNDPLALGHIRSSAGVGEAPTLNANLVNYLRGDGSLAGNTANAIYRSRPELTTAPNGYNVLGTFVNSLPVYIKANNFGHAFLPASVNGKSTGSNGYNSYVRSTKKTREGLVLIGGNDGMLHGFRGSDGVEMFAYIPQTLLKGSSHPLSKSTDLYGLARLANKGYEQQFYMDGQITEADISTCTGTGTAASCGWKNIAIASAGGGGKAVVALDVTPNFSSDSATEPSVFNGSNVLWEIDQSTTTDLGHVMAAPQVGMMASGDWAVVFGNGFDSATGKAALIIAKAGTGEIIKTITASTGSNGLGGVRLVRNADNVVVQAYAGDLQGNVWKFDLSSTNATEWKVDMGGAPLFTAIKNNVAQPITAAPNYLIHPQGGVMVYVSTGKLYSESDTSNKAAQTIYGLWDKAKVGEHKDTADNQIPMEKLLTQLVNSSTTANTTTFRIVASAGNSSITDNRGWKLDMLFSDGERGIYSPQFLQDQVFIQTVRPGTINGESCEVAQGTGYGYLLNPFTGGQPIRPVLDINGNGLVESAGTGDDYGVFKMSSDGQAGIQTGQPNGTLVTNRPEGGSGGGGGTCTAEPCPPCTTDNCPTSHGGGITAPTERLIDRNWRQIFWIIQ